MNIYEAFKALSEEVEEKQPENDRDILIKNLIDQVELPEDPEVEILYDDIYEENEKVYVPLVLRNVPLKVRCEWQGDAEGDYTIYDIEVDADSDAAKYVDRIKRPQDMAEGVVLDASLDVVHDLEITDIKISNTKKADAGIGDYEYWGDEGYDSRPYTEITGDVYISTEMGIWLEIQLKG